MRAWWIALVACCVAGAGSIWYWQRQAVVVGTTPVRRGRAVEAVYATGTVEAENRVEVKARAAGSVIRLLVAPGEHVKQGALLASIDNRNASLELARGKAALDAAAALSAADAPELSSLLSRADSARAELAAAESELARTVNLVQQGAFAAAQLERAQAQVRNLRGALAANEAEQRTLRIKLDAERAQKAAQVDALSARVVETEVRAPLTGVILARHVEPGEVVSVNQPLFVVGDTTSLILELSIDEADIARVHDGQNDDPPSEVVVSLPGYQEQTFAGRVFQIFPDGDRVKKSFLTKVRLLAPPRGLRSGMSAEVNVIVRQHDGLLAPAAVESGGFVWRVQNGHAHKQAVQVGIRDPMRIEFLGGVQEGDPLVLDGRELLTEGVAVRIEPSGGSSPSAVGVAQLAADKSPSAR